MVQVGLPYLAQVVHLSLVQMARLSEVRLWLVQVVHLSLVPVVRLSMDPVVRLSSVLAVRPWKVLVARLSWGQGVLNEKVPEVRIEMDQEVLCEFVRRLLPLLRLQRRLHSVGILDRIL